MELARPVNDPAVKTPAHSAPALRIAAIADPGAGAAPDGPAEHIAERLDGRRPAVVFALTAFAGYLCLLACTDRARPAADPGHPGPDQRAVVG